MISTRLQVTFWMTLLAFTGLVSHAAGKAAYVVSPAGVENFEGDAGTDTAVGPFRIQWLYLASDFVNVIPEGGAVLEGHALRADDREDTHDSITFGDSTFTLATTMNDFLSADFEANLEANRTIVFEGASTNDYPVDGPAGGPNPFGGDLTYSTEFFYDPHTMGNLVIEQVARIGNDVSGHIKDWQTTETDRVAFAPDATAEQATAMDASTIVTRFAMTVPEPSSAALVWTAAAILVANARRKSTPDARPSIA